MISHKFKTVFVHIPKTGGQSVETSFVQAHGLTWETRNELLLRVNKDPALGPERLAHLYAQEYYEKGHISRQLYSAYFSFAIVRHPYDRLLSEYNWRFRRGGPEFGSFLDSVTDDDFIDRNRHMRPQTAYVTNPEGEIIVDEIVRFEEIGKRIPEILAARIGVPTGLPHVNWSKSASRLKHIPKSHLKRVHEMYEDDFELFGFESAAE
ncbi:sulfotransferase family 2 domain-containing protein [Primorskyibacter sp. S87]|uniref:sulfotransferase family 2 domain-containing protein n=1 Tax=Primorskyibacter sp. S87 TaxID=3415126 RepID=UPI003C7E361F